MKKKLAIAGVVLVVVGGAASFILYHWMGGPMYIPGDVRGEAKLVEPLEPPKQPADEDFFQVSTDVRVFSFSTGEGATALVVHGGPGVPSNEPWPGLEPLVDKARFIYFHQRGCGWSTKPFDRFETKNYYENLTELEGKLGLGAQIADIERIRRIVGQEKLILIGHSWGAFLASLYAAEFPERVAAMVLVGPATTVVMPGDGDDFFESIRELLPKDQHQPFDKWREEYLNFGDIFEKSETELAERIRALDRFWRLAAATRGAPVPEAGLSGGNNGGWMVYAMFFSMGWRHDYSSALGRVTAPVLIIHGDRDIQSEKDSRKYLDFFPNAEFRVIKEAGHFPQLEAPEDFATVVAELLDAPPSY